ncbi:hypothetical protein [Solitalea lacus]|uniref:hypothetical protein n=1 Tax=Solitalea lacus TaxID=2911172 RepID=UPI001EDBB8B6|nr:hypothetical protein [Solitalea lacus]UKJ07763.1 hypothetical protein L2B55_01030 [Solitalea lacus]
MIQIKNNPTTPQANFKTSSEKQETTSIGLIFHIDQLAEKRFQDFERHYVSRNIYFSDKVQERWDDFFDNLDDLRLK